jgi:hypothetical protein
MRKQSQHLSIEIHYLARILLRWRLPYRNLTNPAINKITINQNKILSPQCLVAPTLPWASRHKNLPVQKAKAPVPTTAAVHHLFALLGTANIFIGVSLLV